MGRSTAEPIAIATVPVAAAEVRQNDPAAEAAKIKSAIVTDFILSIEIVIIALGTVLQETLTTQIQKLSQILGDVIVGFEDDQPIEVVVGKLLTQKQLTLSTAESCTGGLLASKIVSIAGASAYYKGSIVAYQTALKTSLLQVSEEIIKEHSVVSIPVAEAMALGIQQKMQTSFGIGITGNAGPSSSTSADDLGIVCIALATPNGVISERFDFGQPREKVMLRAANKALEMLLKILSKN